VNLKVTIRRSSKRKHRWQRAWSLRSLAVVAGMKNPKDHAEPTKVVWRSVTISLNPSFRFCSIIDKTCLKRIQGDTLNQTAIKVHCYIYLYIHEIKVT